MLFLSFQPVWPDLAKFWHFGNFGRFLENVWAYFCKFLYYWANGVIVANGQILKIKSCHLVALHPVPSGRIQTNDLFNSRVYFPTLHLLRYLSVFWILLFPFQHFQLHRSALVWLHPKITFEWRIYYLRSFGVKEILMYRCGSVGRSIASDTRGPRLESSHRHILFTYLLIQSSVLKSQNKEKRPEMAQL